METMRGLEGSQNAGLTIIQGSAGPVLPGYVSRWLALADEGNVTRAGRHALLRLH